MAEAHPETARDPDRGPDHDHDLEPYGRIDQDLPAWADDRPTRIALIGHFSGQPTAAKANGLPLRAWRVDRDRFDTVMAAIAPQMSWDEGAMASPSQPALVFSDLDGFHPDSLQRLVNPAVGSADGEALRRLLHDPALQALESLWRGVDWLIQRLSTGADLELHLIDMDRAALTESLAAERLTESSLYQTLVATPAQDHRGGYTHVALCMPLAFNRQDLAVAGRAALIARHAGACLLAELQTGPLETPSDPPDTSLMAALDALRSSEQASHLALLSPRWLLRHAYGRRGEPVQAASFEELRSAADVPSLLWGSPVWPALCVLGADPPEGAQDTAVGALTVDGLPQAWFRDASGDVVAVPCTERLISSQTAAQWLALGIHALMAHRGAPAARWCGLATLNGQPLPRCGHGRRPLFTDIQSTVQVSLNARHMAPASDASAKDEENETPASASASASTWASSLSSTSTTSASASSASSLPSAWEADAFASSLGDATTSVDDSAALTSSTSSTPPTTVPEADAGQDDDLAALLASFKRQDT
ncbi:type VI secretion system contractile sheath domain-containing protein [Roseateles amylovorans]|uniref:Type VI secretion system contractile sheath large subunit n=1 Tax=Roseateles amylovorans TaxID=2978473 RepID=A0ABY6B5J6_9BURK|nr:type VI secretion system contractile sheath large subunit [Roseateles amylovorans]UXH78530.1 type VI secretion system contractile sheath large subunit [Roseateles amylovorans]